MTGTARLERGTKRLLVAPAVEGGDLVGRRVAGRYDVEAIVGQGGMGTVYLARHATLGRAFAVKLLRREIAAVPEAVSRFLQGAKVTATIRHENVVDVVDFGELTEAELPSLGPTRQPYFVMEQPAGREPGRAGLARGDARHGARRRGLLAGRGRARRRARARRGPP